MKKRNKLWLVYYLIIVLFLSGISIMMFMVASKRQVISLTVVNAPRISQIGTLPDSTWLSTSKPAFVSEGTQLVSQGAGGAVILWDLSSGQQLNTLFRNDATSIEQLTTSPDGLYLAYVRGGYDSSTVYLLNIQDRKSEGDFETNGDAIRALEFDQSGQAIAAGSFNKVTFWDFPSRSLIYEINDPAIGEITSLAFQPDTSIVALGNAIGLINLWNWKTRQRVETLKGHTGAIRDLEFSPDGSVLVSAGEDRSIRLWTIDLPSHSILLNGSDEVVTSISFSVNGSLLASGDRAGRVIIWDIVAKEIAATLDNPNAPSPTYVSFSVNGLYLITKSLGYPILLWGVYK